MNKNEIFTDPRTFLCIIAPPKSLAFSSGMTAPMQNLPQRHGGRWSSPVNFIARVAFPFKGFLNTLQTIPHPLDTFTC